MDRRFKERLIGAVVLAAVAVLILPAVLNGPHAPLPEPAAPAETAMHTETIELEPAQRFDERAASPAAAPPHSPAAKAPAEPEAAASSPAATAPAPKEQPAPAAAKASPATAPPAESKQPAVPGPAATTAKAAAPPPALPAEPAGSGWAVQVGTFASSPNATALAASLKARGYAAFVAPLATGDKTLYRVRVGPTADVESARALEQRLEKEGQKEANVVRQP